MTIPVPKPGIDWRDADTTSESPTEELGLSDAKSLAIELVPELASYHYTDNFFEADERDIAVVFDHNARTEDSTRLALGCFILPFIAVAIFLWNIFAMMVTDGSDASGIVIFACFSTFWTGFIVLWLALLCRSPSLPHTAITIDGVLHNVSTGESAPTGSSIWHAC